MRLDLSEEQHKIIDETFSIDIFNSNSGDNGQSTSKLIRLKSNLDEKNQFISFCEQHYIEYKVKLDELGNFLQEYSADKALWWYSRDTCLYKLLNEALRNTDINLLFVLRFLIRDIGNELEKNKCKSSIHVYRGQWMSGYEIKKLKHSIGQLISIKSFFSTSLKREKALSFINIPTHSDGSKRVLFEIEADAQLSNVKPFADISEKSAFKHEAEILFMLGSIFRLIKVSRDSTGIWIIKMKLCSNDDNQLKSLLEHMMNEYGSGETNLFLFGNVLRGMGKLNDAEKYYHCFLREVPEDHQDIAGCYHSLGIVADEKGDYELSLEWLNKSLKIDMQSPSDSKQPNIAQSHNSIGIIYLRKHDYKQALKYFNEALLIFIRVFGEDSSETARCYINMGTIYENEDKYSEALDYYQKALSIRQKYFPANHLDIGQSHSCIGNIYLLLDNFDLALRYYMFALQIYGKSCSDLHPDVAVAYENIGIVYERKGDLKSALSCFEKAGKIYNDICPDTHSMIKINASINRVSSKIKII
jgi:tetratricopeptide (TPR) repeat protein